MLKTQKRPMKKALPKYETGVIHGRFQILHNDHLKYILSGKALCQNLVVGITNPDTRLTRKESADPHRSAPDANPLTYFERYMLVKTVLGEAGVPPEDLAIVPFPINFPELYANYVPMDAVFFLTIYDNWGRKKLEYFTSVGLKRHVLWDVPTEEKGISAGHIRQCMIQQLPWEHMVPQSAAPLLKAWRIPERLKVIASNRKAKGPL